MEKWDELKFEEVGKSVSDEGVFNRLAGIGAEGIGFHSHLADSLLKMGLDGFSLMQEVRFNYEARGLREIHRRIVRSFGEEPCLIVDVRTEPVTDCRSFIHQWVSWEQHVHDVYEIALNEVETESSELYIAERLREQKKELDFAERLRAKLEAVNYDEEAIAAIQPELSEHYMKELEDAENKG